MIFSFPRIVAAAAQLRVDLRLDRARAELVGRSAPSAAVTSGRPMSRLVFARELLDERLPTVDPATARMCVQQCEQLLQRQSAHSSIRSVVRSLMLHEPQRFPPINEIAQRLGLSERSLRRQLACDDTSYQALLNEVREALATELLTTTTLPVEQVARRLGYSETASFTRAFTRWCGKSPRQYRRGGR